MNAHDVTSKETLWGSKYVIRLFLVILSALIMDQAWHPASAWSREIPLNYPSPDKTLTAGLIPTGRVPTGKDANDDDFDYSQYESIVEVRDSASHVQWRHGFSSPDHEHGRGVQYAAWSPDSRFFVFSTTSSGGHSPWHFHTGVFDRQVRAMFWLDDYTGPVVDPHFTFTDGDTITVQVHDTKQTVKANLHQLFDKAELLKEQYGHDDKELNQAYTLLKNVCPPDEQKQLTTAQLAWIKYRDLAVASRVAITKAMDPKNREIELNVSAELTRDRYDQLKDLPIEANLHQPLDESTTPKVEYERNDRLLNQAYDLLKKVCAPEEQKQLTEAQLAWLKFRDLAVASQVAIIKPADARKCEIELNLLDRLTRDRRWQLIRILIDLDDQGVSGIRESIKELKQWL